MRQFIGGLSFVGVLFLLIFKPVSVCGEPQPFQLNFAGSEKLSGQWPGWRGWNTGGVSDEKPLPDFLNTTTQLWNVELAPGHSSPVIWDDLIFVTSVQTATNGKPYLVVRALEKSDGKTRWAKSLQWMTGRLHTDNSYASHTVATDGSAVFVTSGFQDSNLYALSIKDGAIVWKKSLGSMDHEYGTSVGPIIYKDRVIQLCDSEFNSSLKAFDRSTGKLLWSTPRNSTGSWGTPALVKDSEKTFVLVVPGGGMFREADGSIRGYDPETGKELWSVDGTTAYVCPSPIIGRRHIFCGSGRMEGPLFALRARREEKNARVSWQLPRGGGYVPTGVYYHDRLYMISYFGVFAVYDTESAEVDKEPKQLAKYRLGRGRIVTASLIAGDGKIYSASNDGNIYVLSEGDKPLLISTNHMGEPVYATPAISNGVIYVRSAKRLSAYAKK